jgi:DNA-binding HxlR family transcriptional regulator
MREELRSDCPINFALELIGDKWSLLIVRDMLLDGKTSYGDFASSQEGIATNILSNRLLSLESAGVITKNLDPKNKRRYIYTLTSKGLDLIPLFLEIMLWSAKYHSAPDERKELLDHIRSDREAAMEDLRVSYQSRIKSLAPRP